MATKNIIIVCQQVLEHRVPNALHNLKFPMSIFTYTSWLQKADYTLCHQMTAIAQVRLIITLEEFALQQQSRNSLTAR